MLHVDSPILFSFLGARPPEYESSHPSGFHITLMHVLWKRSHTCTRQLSYQMLALGLWSSVSDSLNWWNENQNAVSKQSLYISWNNQIVNNLYLGSKTFNKKKMQIDTLVIVYEFLFLIAYLKCIKWNYKINPQLHPYLKIHHIQWIYS